jgi:hypothetical protein
MYAQWTGTKWTTDIIDDSVRYTPSSLTLDAYDTPYLSYYNSNFETLSYAYLTAEGNWASDTVYNGRAVYSSLALGSDGTPHIVFVDTTSDDLLHLWMDGSNWQSETVDHGAFYGADASLALAPTAPFTPHVSYAGDGLRYAVFDGADWITESISPASIWGTSLALEPAPPYRPRIAYYDTTNDEMRYAHFTGSTWNIDVVHNADDSGTGIGLAIAFTAPYTPHIAYTADRDLYYAYWNGSTWIRERLESGGSIWYERSGDASITLDSDNHPHIIYDGYYTGLRYAHWTGSQWEIEEVTFYHSYGQTAIELDSLDRPHILYLSHSNGEVTYAYREGDAWTFEIVEDTSLQSDLSLALDGNDQPHVAYYHYETDKLVYATRQNGTWAYEVVDQLGGTSPSLALDGYGHPRIAYAEGTDLKFAWKTVVNQVPETGGTMAAYDTADFKFPSGALTETVTITCTVLESFGLQPDVGILYDIEATSASTGQPAAIAPGETYTVVVYYDQADVPAIVDESQLALYYWDDDRSEWVKEPTSVVDIVNNTITATPSHFSIWGALGDEVETVFLPLVFRD